jgi:deoxyribonuclease-4
VPSRKRSPVGVHVPVSRGLAASGLRYAREVGAEAVQVFVGNPRGWAPAAGDRRQDALFRAGCEAARMPAFVHAPYLVNFGSPTPLTVSRSVAALRHTIARGRDLGARGVVVHTGSAVSEAARSVAMRQVREALLPVLDALPDDAPDVLLEPTAGQGMSLCSAVEELSPYLDELDRHERVGVCLDTCHAHAAGHDLAVPGGLRRTLDSLVKSAGRGRLRLVHANDSKDPVGSLRDRHESLGKGHVGSEPFAELFRHPAMRGVPVVLETPGKAAEHRRDLVELKSLRDR